MVVLSLHLLVCICLIGLVLLQRSEGGALGMGGGGGALMSGRGAADALAKMTSFAGAFFLATSLGLTVISGAAQSSENRSVFDLLPKQAPAPAAPAEPARSDPTESSAPEAAETQLASAAPAQTITLAPAPAAASTRAGPVVQRPAAGPIPASVSANSARAPQTQSAAVTTNRAPAGSPASATQRPASNQPAAASNNAPATISPRPPALVIPNTSGAGLLPDDGASAQLAPESGQSDAVEAVRRERAGPDQ
jgi:preprotein translocase subunit SecG